MVEPGDPSDAVDPRVARTRARVLGAARELLLTRGLDAVTHLEVARRSGVGRRTVYRHWPERVDLLHDTLAAAEFPHADVIGDLRADLVAHLDALRTALVDGPLAFVIHALNERAAVEPSLAPLRDRLTEEGCAPVRALLRDAVATGRLSADLDVDEAAAELEGPVFYWGLVRHEPVPPDVPARVVDRFLARAGPPRRPGRSPTAHH